MYKTDILQMPTHTVCDICSTQLSALITAIMTCIFGISNFLLSNPTPERGFVSYLTWNNKSLASEKTWNAASMGRNI